MSNIQNIIGTMDYSLPRDHRYQQYNGFENVNGRGISTPTDRDEKNRERDDQILMDYFDAPVVDVVACSCRGKIERLYSKDYRPEAIVNGREAFDGDLGD